MAHEENTQDAAETARRARFGALPQRITPAEMVEEKPASVVDPARNDYNDDAWLVRMGAF
ncbi:hypothetical protein [Streptomyces sp. NPDC088766]|uniref:hypothetical protein n=1 Tax=Streptomyces sp. NPDC088766 TaxID=3365893 RepID=UPI00382496D9